MPKKSQQKKNKAKDGSNGKGKKKKQPQELGKHWYWASSFLVVLAGLVVLLIAFNLVFANKVYPGVTVAGINLGGKSYRQAQEVLQDRVQRLNGQDFIISTPEKKIVLDPVVSSLGDPDLAYELYNIEALETAKAAYYYGRRGRLADNLAQQIRALAAGSVVPVSYTIDRPAIKELLRVNFSSLEDPAQDASIALDNSGRPELIEAKSGEGFDYEKVVRQIEEGIANLRGGEISMEKSPQMPAITADQAIHAFNRVPGVLALVPITLKHENDSWTIPRTELAGWLVFEQDSQGSVYLALSEQEAEEFFERIARRVNVTPLDAKFNIEDGRVTEFQGSRDGVELDILATLEKLEKDVLGMSKDESGLVVRTTKAKVTTEEVNNLGITEILGAGTSNFAGSPANRRHNIKVASDKLHGYLIAPEEEFSLVEALKPFTSAAGYLPELVIKGNKLIPEIGGGACQIGTTTFRAALSSGLEITQRRNHSFAVSYYNDENGLPGTDATIYDPAPDFRFKNNTASHILIQTRIEGDELIYEFWGTNDGREATTTKPVILSRIGAPATKYIETTDLEPGVQSCSGSNVPGYSTTFTYKVEKPDGTVEERNFDSRYRPWQRVCLVGVEELSKLEENDGGEIVE